MAQSTTISVCVPCSYSFSSHNARHSQNGDDDTPMARKRKVEDGDMAGVGPMGATQAAIAAAGKLENQLQSAGSAGERHHLVAAAVEQAGTMQALMHAAVAQNAFYALEALLSVARESQGQGWQPVGPAQGARQAGITQDATRELLSNASDTMFQRTTCAICMEIMVAPYTGEGRCGEGKGWSCTMPCACALRAWGAWWLQTCLFLSACLTCTCTLPTPVSLSAPLVPHQHPHPHPPQ